MLLDQENERCENDHPYQKLFIDSMQSQLKPHAIPHGVRKEILKIHMEAQKALENQHNPEQKELSLTHSHTHPQVILQSHSDENSVNRHKKQTHRSVEKTRRLRL